MMKENEMVLSLDAVRERLMDRRLYKVAEETGLTYPTLKGIVDGSRTSIKSSTLEALSKYLLK